MGERTAAALLKNLPSYSLKMKKLTKSIPEKVDNALHLRMGLLRDSNVRSANSVVLQSVAKLMQRLPLNMGLKHYYKFNKNCLIFVY